MLDSIVPILVDILETEERVSSFCLKVLGLIISLMSCCQPLPLGK